MPIITITNDTDHVLQVVRVKAVKTLAFPGKGNRGSVWFIVGGSERQVDRLMRKAIEQIHNGGK